MPRGDGTGPMGMGPMSGRGMGFCTGYAMPGYIGGRGMGCGRGFRRMYTVPGNNGWARYGAMPYNYPGYAASDKAPVADEKEILQNQADYLEKQLEQVRERLKDFKEE